MSVDLDAFVDVAHLDREGQVGAEEAFDVRLRTAREVVTDLVARDQAARPDRAEQRQGQRSRTDSRLEHLRTGENIGEDEDRPEILRIDHLRATRHLEDVLGQRGPHRDEARAERGAHGRALGCTDERVVFEYPRVRVELATR